MVATGERNANYIRTTRLFLDNDEWGLYVMNFHPSFSTDAFNPMLFIM
jgi:hypothetical protein